MSTYYNQLHPWCIIHCLPNAQTHIIARFRRRSEADAQLRILHRLSPSATYEIIFDRVHRNDEGSHPE